MDKPIKFTKEQILASKRYRYQSDVTDAVLKDGREYTLKEVDSLIKKYMEGSVK